MDSFLLFFVTGISGSGKTTVARRLIEQGEIALDSKIQPGLFRFTDPGGNEAPDYRPQDPEWQRLYRWSLNKPVLDELLSKHADAKRVFLCGGAQDLMQYWPLGRQVFLLKIDEKKRCCTGSAAPTATTSSVKTY